MKKRIYLFCNEQYGAAYIRVFQAAAERFPEFDCFVIFSARGEAVGILPKLIRQLCHLQKRVFGQFGNLLISRVKVMDVADVNLPNFYSTVPVGSIGFVAGFNQIFKSKTIDLFSIFVNFHPSLLPYYRGSIPSYWVIKNNEMITGFTAHIVSQQIDAGEIIYQESVEINPGLSETELDRKIAYNGAFYFNECLNNIAVGKPFRKKRINSTYSQKVDYVSATRE
jgi:hypothetical protein